MKKFIAIFITIILLTSLNHALAKENKSVNKSPLHFIKLPDTLKHSDAYTKENAMILAKTINAVTTATKESNTIVPPAGYHLIQPLNIYENGHPILFGGIFASRFRNHLIVVFRGIMTDYEKNMEAITALTPFDNHKQYQVNAGKWALYQQLRRDLTTTLRKYPNVTHVWFTGHAVGGAVATIAAYDALAYVGDKQTISLTTFGAPRVVNPDLAKAMNESKIIAFRVVNIEDTMVDSLAAITEHGRYQHIRKPIFYQFNGDTAAQNHEFYFSADFGKDDILNTLT